MQSMQQQIVNLLSIQSRPQKENVEALSKEANNFSLEFEELPRLEQLASLGKTWLEPVRKLLAPIKALWNHGLVRLDQLFALQKEFCLLMRFVLSSYLCCENQLGFESNYN